MESLESKRKHSNVTYEWRKKNGFCIKCAELLNAKDGTFLTCRKCRERNKQKLVKLKAKRIKEGRCIYCNSSVLEEGHKSCRACMDLHNWYTKRAYRKRCATKIREEQAVVINA